MLGKVEIIKQGRGQSCTWEYYCGKCGKVITRTSGNWPSKNRKRTEKRRCSKCKIDNKYNIIGKDL